MSYSDDTAEFWFTGRTPQPTGFTNRKIRMACRNCGNSNIRFISTGDRGWAFECRRCGMDTWFTDEELTGGKQGLLPPADVETRSVERSGKSNQEGT